MGILAWRAELDRVPVLTSLAKRNIRIVSVDCPACGVMEETAEHVFITCGLAQAVWQAITIWCKVPPIFTFNIRDILELHKYSKFPKRKANSFYAVCLVSLWCLWKARNDMVFNGMAITVDSVVSEIKGLSYLWVKNRSGVSQLSWED
ncbi:uncharacterized protein LOC143609226 [Bidens hawaiensis]|uniref:uncharacterized protein LOC143609226 n=1 Tax=Bidens hawaiensis TaxID=980011 RepID=UPI004049D459